jgi:LCP family protein required for cell wall assembly
MKDNEGRAEVSAEGKNEKKKVSPGKIFLKFFVIAFVCGAVGVTAGLGAIDSLLATKPMDKSSSEVRALQPVGQTPEKLNILIDGEGAFKTDPVLKNSKRVNILIFGNTINKSETKGLTDTIMLGSLDPDTKKFDIISVPRDTYYERSGYSGAFLKINSVMESDGVKAACESVHNVLQGIPINYYAVINYDGVAKIVDAIGGVPVDVPFNMHYTDKKQGLYINLKKGEQRLDGEHAIQFLRYRHGYREGDIGRVAAQQKFVKAAVKEALGLNLPKVAKTVIENVDSDVDIRALLFLASKATDIDSGDINSHMLPGDAGYINKLSFWIPSESDKIVEAVREIYADGPVTSGGAVSPGAVDQSTQGAVGQSGSGSVPGSSETAE